jgi:hypothetical protein
MTGFPMLRSLILGSFACCDRIAINASLILTSTEKNTAIDPRV